MSRNPAMRMSALGLALCTAVSATTAWSQDVISRDLYEDRLRNDGNKITFCYNTAGMMAEFDRALAQTIGDALLAEVAFFTVDRNDYRGTLPRLDYRIPLSPEQIFFMMAEHCDAFMGFLVNNRTPEWMVVTRPYLSVTPVMVTTDPEIKAASDLPADARIGTRMMAGGDTELISFIAAGGAAKAWKRVPYFDPMLAIERLREGVNDVAMIWSPGLYALTGGDPGAEGLYPLDKLPFPARATELGIATRTQDGYLNTLLSDAIAALEADGTIEALMIAHTLVPKSGP